MPTFKTEALRLVSNVELVKRIYHLINERQIRHYLALPWQEFMTLFVIRPRPSVISTANVI